MKKLLFSLLTWQFLVAQPTAPSQEVLVLSPLEQFHLVQGGAASPVYHTQLPANPRLYEDSWAYSDPTLTQTSRVLDKKQPLVLSRLVVNEQLVPVFELASGDYLAASPLLVFDDQEVWRQASQGSFWLADAFTLYEAPYRFGVKPAKADLSPYQKVEVTEEAQTYEGHYYKIGDKGWVKSDQLLTSAQRMGAVQKLLNDKYHKEGLAIYVEDLETGDVAELNADQVMYAASVSKLAILYHVQGMLNDNRVSLDTPLTYIEAVNDYRGAYDTAGTGAISKTADNKDYRVEDLLKALAQSSDNAASNILGYYLTDQNSSDFQAAMSAIAGQDWDMKERLLSAKAAAKMMVALYRQGGLVMDYLSDTDFKDSRISKGIEGRVAHKTGDAYEFRHDVAVVYADQPYVLAIFTDQASHDDLTVIAQEVSRILK